MRRQRAGALSVPAFTCQSALARLPLRALRHSSSVCQRRPPLVAPPLYPCMVAHGSAQEENASTQYGTISATARREQRSSEHSPQDLSPSEHSLQELPPSEDSLQELALSEISSDDPASMDAPPSLVDPPQGPEKRLLLAGGAFFLVLVGGSIAAAKAGLNGDALMSLAAWFETLGPSAVYLYAGLYFALELVGVPALPLTLGSGYLFGLPLGTVAVSISSTLAAATSFLIARYGLRSYVAKVAAKYPKFRSMDRAIGRQGFKFVFLLRLSPLLPFAISNYLYGLTSVEFLPYVAGSWLGMLPGTIAYVSAGAAVQALTDLSAGQNNVNPILLVIGFAATVAVLMIIGKVVSEAIEAEDEEFTQN